MMFMIEFLRYPDAVPDFVNASPLVDSVIFQYIKTLQYKNRLFTVKWHFFSFTKSLTDPGLQGPMKPTTDMTLSRDSNHENTARQ